MKHNCSIGKSYSVKEKVSGSKFRSGMLNLVNPILWLKDLSSLFNLRKLIMFAIVIGIIFGYGYWKGKRNTPIVTTIKGEVLQIEENKFLHFDKNGHVYLKTKEGKVIKQLMVKDLPQLSKKLRPYGLIFEPILVGGIAMGTEGVKPEFGAGFSFLKYFRWRLETFITNHPAIYLGASYKLEGLKLENSSIGVAYGRAFRGGDTRIMVYWRVAF